MPAQRGLAHSQGHHVRIRLKRLADGSKAPEILGEVAGTSSSARQGHEWMETENLPIPGILVSLALLAERRNRGAFGIRIAFVLIGLRPFPKKLGGR